MGNVKRAYHSAKRQRQAEATRARLAASARRLFVRDGYAATSIEAIAGDAGVAVQTFYATYGSKRAVLQALLGELERAADLEGLGRALQGSEDPRGQLALVVDFNIRLFGQAGDVLGVLQAAGGTDPDLRSVWREGEDRRRQGQAPLVRKWARGGALRRGVTERRAADILWALTGPDTYRLFVEERGWPAAELGDWLWSTVEELLFEA